MGLNILSFLEYWGVRCMLEFCLPSVRKQDKATVVVALSMPVVRRTQFPRWCSVVLDSWCRNVAGSTRHLMQLRG